MKKLNLSIIKETTGGSWQIALLNKETNVELVLLELVEGIIG